MWVGKPGGMRSGHAVIVTLWFLLLSLGCTSTRRLADLGDARLRTPGQSGGFVVATTERWHERIDPNTAIRFRDASGRVTDQLHGRQLHVDDAGVWIDRRVSLSRLADRVRITGIDDAVAGALERARPADAELRRDGTAWILVATGPTLATWVGDFELAVARLDPVSTHTECHLDNKCTELAGDDAKLFRLRHLRPTRLGTWQLFSARRGWGPAVTGYRLYDLLDGGRVTRVGWQWSEIDGIEVTNLSGGKTLAAIAGYTALGIALAPIALLGVGRGAVARSTGGGGGGGSGRTGGSIGGAVDAIGHAGGGDRPPRPGDWAPELADRASANARPLFGRWSKVHAIVRATVALDGAAATRGDLVTTGAIAKLRFADVFEIGGGVRVAESRGMTGAWSTATTGLFHVGLHLPLDAGFRVAIPLGLEVGGGGAVERELRIPWGLRYTAKSERWFATLHPATPAYLRRVDGHYGTDRVGDGRWSLAIGGELGASF